MKHKLLIGLAVLVTLTALLVVSCAKATPTPTPKPTATPTATPMKAATPTPKPSGEEPSGKVIFANSGVRLTTAGSDLIEDLRGLEESGSEIISCGTCLDYYQLVDSLQVGVASNMYEIVSALVEADRVVKP